MHIPKSPKSSGGASGEVVFSSVIAVQTQLGSPSTGRPQSQPITPPSSCTMPSPSPIPSYVLGVGSIGLGLNAFFNPRGEYGRFGLPLESPKSVSANDNDAHQPGYASPLIYLKSIREITYGLALIAFQLQDNTEAVTTFAGVVSLAGLFDGVLVRAHGGPFKFKQWGHFFAFAGIAAWSLWRFKKY
jgi:hypothetical protein